MDFLFEYTAKFIYKVGIINVTSQG
jgi:hypothetical protein